MSGFLCLRGGEEVVGLVSVVWSMVWRDRTDGYMLRFCVMEKRRLHWLRLDINWKTNELMSTF